MAITGNKGEWGEIYTLLKLLGDGKVHAGDQNMNKIKDLFYPIIMILREENNNHLNYIREEQDVVIQTPEREELLRIPSSIFLEEAEELLKSITENNGAFSVPRIETFMQKIHCNTLKTKSTNKKRHQNNFPRPTNENKFGNGFQHKNTTRTSLYFAKC